MLKYDAVAPLERSGNKAIEFFLRRDILGGVRWVCRRAGIPDGAHCRDPPLRGAMGLQRAGIPDGAHCRNPPL